MCSQSWELPRAPPDCVTITLDDPREVDWTYNTSVHSAAPYAPHWWQDRISEYPGVGSWVPGLRKQALGPKAESRFWSFPQPADEVRV